MVLKKLLAFLAMVLILAGFVGADFALLYSTYVRCEYVQGELEKVLGRPVRLRDLHCSLRDGFTAAGLEVPGRNRADFLKAERISIKLDSSKLADGQVAIRSVELVEPMIRMEMDAEGRCELFDFLAEVAERAGTEGAKRGAIPQVYVRDGRFVFSHAAFVVAGRPVEVAGVNAEILPYGPEEFVVRGTADIGELGRWTIEGRIDTAASRIELAFSTAALDVGDRTVERFSDEVRAAYARYGIRGPVDVRVRFAYDPAAPRPVAVLAEIVARGIEVTYENFPYRVVNVHGTIRAKDDGIEFHDMSAKFWLRTVEESGTKRFVESAVPVVDQLPMEVFMNGLTDGYDSAAAYKLYFDIRNLPVNEKLKGALQPAARNVYDMFSPDGSVSGKVEVVKEAGKGLPIVHNVEMEMQSCKATFKPFPYPITDATGKIVLRGDHLWITGARCRHGEAQFEIDGELSSIEPDGSIGVTVRGRDIPLDPEARAALPGAVGAVWEHFSPEGRIDLLWKTTREEGPDKELKYDVTVTPRGLKACYDGVPYALSDLRGEVWTDAKEVRIERLEGTHGGATVLVRGAVKDLDRDDPAYELTIDASEIPVDGELRAAVPDDLATMVTDIGLKGVLKLRKLKFRKGGAGLRPGQMEYQAEGIELYDASFDAGLEFREATLELGTVQGRIDDAGHKLTARIRPSRLRAEDYQVQNLIGNVKYQDSFLTLHDLEGSCYDGRIGGDVFFDVGDASFETRLRINDVDLLQLTKDTSFSGKNIAGKVTGELSMTGVGGDGTTYEGKGQLVLKQSELWEVPLFVGIFSKLNLGKKDKFESGFLRFGIDKGTRKLKVRELKLESDSLNLSSEKGWLDFDGNLRLLMHPDFDRKSLWQIPLTLFDKLIEGTMAIGVKGTFKEPDVSIEATVDLLRLIGAE